jgi:hypothetical protein
MLSNLERLARPNTQGIAAVESAQMSPTFRSIVLIPVSIFRLNACLASDDVASDRDPGNSRRAHRP